IDFGIFDTLTYRWRLAPVVAHTVSFVFSCVASFVLNRIWTFELEGRVDWMREGVPFLLFSLLGWGLQALAIVVAERRFGYGVVRAGQHIVQPGVDLGLLLESVGRPLHGDVRGGDPGGGVGVDVVNRSEQRQHPGDPALPDPGQLLVATDAPVDLALPAGPLR